MYATQQQVGYRPQQYVGTIGGYYPLQTDTWTSMFSMMMPMLMFVLMFAIITPLFKGITARS